MRFCVYQGITTLINSAYKNWGHAQVVATNLKQRRMWKSFIRQTKTLFNYEKIITARMHTRDNNDVDNKTSDAMAKKMGNRATTHT
jgi:hypothetical protein